MTKEFVINFDTLSDHARDQALLIKKGYKWSFSGTTIIASKFKRIIVAENIINIIADDYRVRDPLIYIYRNASDVPVYVPPASEIPKIDIRKALVDLGFIDLHVDFQIRAIQRGLIWCGSGTRLHNGEPLRYVGVEGNKMYNLSQKIEGVPQEYLGAPRLNPSTFYLEVPIQSHIHSGGLTSGFGPFETAFGYTSPTIAPIYYQSFPAMLHKPETFGIPPVKEKEKINEELYHKRRKIKVDI